MQYAGAAPNNAALDAACSAVGLAWFNTLGTLINNNTNVASVTAADLTSPSGAVGLNTTSRVGATVPASPLPNNTAMCITWKVQSRWRGGHPRTYMTGFNQALVVNGNSWSGSFITSMNTQVLAFRTALNAITAGSLAWTFVCLRRHQTLVDGTHVILNPAVPIPITSGFVDSRIDSQRRRLGPDVPA